MTRITESKKMFLSGELYCRHTSGRSPWPKYGEFVIHIGLTYRRCHPVSSYWFLWLLEYNIIAQECIHIENCLFLWWIFRSKWVVRIKISATEIGRAYKELETGSTKSIYVRSSFGLLQASLLFTKWSFQKLGSGHCGRTPIRIPWDRYQEEWWLSIHRIDFT
jgi:hypothetical protein